MLGIGWNKVFETSELFLVQHFVKVLVRGMIHASVSCKGLYFHLESNE